MTLPPGEAALLAGDPVAEEIWAQIRARVLGWPGVHLKLQKSQIGLWAAHPFAAVWSPGRALGHAAAPLVLSVFGRERLDGSWTEVVEPAPGRFTHHLEVWAPGDVTPAVLEVLERAAEAAR